MLLADQATGDDMRLLSLAYIEFLVLEDKDALRHLEEDPRLVARSVGSLAWLLMDSVVIPVENGVDWSDGWVSVDFQARIDPEFKANLIRRRRYRRLSYGLTLRPKGRLRRTAQDCVSMLCLAHVTEFGRHSIVTRREAVLEMVRHFRDRLCRTGDAQGNA